MANKYGVKEVADVTFYDIATGKPLLFLDTLKMTTIENTAETSYARGGKGNPKLLSWDFNREGTIQMSDALMSTKSLSMLAGTTTVSGIANVYGREVLTAIAGAASKTKVTTKKLPMETSIYVTGLDDEPIVSTFTTPDIIFAETAVPLGTKVIVYYQYATDATAQTITISADKFPGYVRVVGDTVVRNAETGVDEAFQIIIDKAKISPTFTFTFQADGDPSVFDMNLEIFKRTQDSQLYRMVKY